MTRQQFQKLPLRKKLSCLLEKYLAASVLAVFLVSAVGTLIYEEHFKVQPLLRVDMIDVNTDSADSRAFEGFLTQAGYPGRSDMVKLDKRYQFGGTQEDLQIMPDHLMICNASAGKTDIYFWNTPYIEETLAATVLADLRTVLPQEFLMENQDILIYTAPLLDGGYPCGISLRENPWVKENNYYSDCAVGISRKTQAKELTSQFLQYLSSPADPI